ncbi:MAG: hypothetical protein ACWGQW_08765, partial [bacterium]
EWYRHCKSDEMKTFVLNGRNNDVIRNYLRMLPYDGTYKIEIKKVESKRSLSQNALYWMWVTIIANDIGHTKDEMHDLLRFTLLNPITTEVMGRVIEQLPSTTKMKTKEFVEYLNAIEMWAADFGILLPQPEDIYYEAMGYKRKQNEPSKTKALPQQEDTGGS